MALESFDARREKRRARREQLLSKTINELVELIILLEEENEKTREYRAKLIKIRNLVVPDDEKRKKGRPTKDEKVI